jgi:hypothetical protein
MRSLAPQWHESLRMLFSCSVRSFRLRPRARSFNSQVFIFVRCLLRGDRPMLNYVDFDGLDPMALFEKRARGLHSVDWPVVSRRKGRVFLCRLLPL